MSFFTFQDALNEAKSNSDEIVSVPQAVEIIADMFKKAGFKATKLKNYGYYSFQVNNIDYGSKIKSLFKSDNRFKFTEKNSYLEYEIEVKDIEVIFSLKYESDKKGSRLVLDLDL